MQALLSDVRYAVRSLRSTPSFTLAVVLVLSLGIGASTAGYGVANWLLFRPLPGVTDGHRVGVVWFGERRPGGFLSQYPVTVSQLPGVVSAVPAFGGLVGHKAAAVSVAARDRSRRVDVEFVMPSYFTVLGTRPELGRLLTAEDDAAPSGVTVAVLGYDLWRDLFAGDPAILGQQLRVNTYSFTVVGVAPRGFHGAEQGRAFDLWLPGRTSLLIYAALGARTALEPDYSEFVARLSDGATFDQAERQLRDASLRVIGQPPVVFRGIGVWPPIRATAEDTAQLLLAVTGFLLLIACANAANLQLFRGLGRRPGTAIRKVLGAGAWDVVRGQLLEGAMLGVAAAAAGLQLGRWFVDGFQGMSLWRNGAPLQHLPLDWRVALFASAAGLASTLLAGVVPGVFAARTSALEAVRGSGFGRTRGSGLRRAFGGLQVALSVALLVGALLLVQTLRRLGGVDLGFDPTGVSAVSMTPYDQGYSQQRLQPYYRALLHQVRAIPGVESASLSSSAPFSPLSAFSVATITAASSPTGAPAAPVVFTATSTGYFATLGIPMVAGRDFTEDDFLNSSDSLRRVAIASQSLSRRLFGDRNPVGQLVGPNPRAEIVGVVGDARFRALEGTALGPATEGEMIYFPFRGGGLATLLVRSSRPHAETMAAVQTIASRLDSSIPLHHSVTLRDAIRDYISDRVLLARLLALLAAAGVMLAAGGVYGLMAYGVTARTREIGIRKALGAQRSQVLLAVLRESGTLGVAGTGLGLGGALVVGRLLQSRLFGVSPAEPVLYLGASTALMVISVLAAVLPARAATRVDPMVALRAE